MASVLQEEPIRLALVATIKGLFPDAIVLSYDPENEEELVDANGVINGFTVELGDEMKQNQVRISRIGLGGQLGYEQGGSYRVDWQYTIRGFLSITDFDHHQMTERMIDLMEELLTKQTLGGVVDLMWAPPDLLEIDSARLSDRDVIWYSCLTAGWSQHIGVNQS